LSNERFDSYLYDIKQNKTVGSPLLVTEFSYFRYRIHEQCHQLATARPDGIRFMQWLRENNWKIIICTHRDLRLASAYTKRWLENNAIPFDYLFTAINKIVFCNLWKIPYLIDDAEFNLIYGAQYGVTVYYPIMEKHKAVAQNTARGFSRFGEVQQWLQESPY
jgi:hypothetical protein